MNPLIKSEWNEKQNKQKQLYIPRKTLLFLNQTNKCISLFMCILNLVMILLHLILIHQGSRRSDFERN